MAGVALRFARPLPDRIHLAIAGHRMIVIRWSLLLISWSIRSSLESSSRWVIIHFVTPVTRAGKMLFAGCLLTCRLSYTILSSVCLRRSTGPSDDRQTRLLAFRINQPAFSCLSEQLSNLIFSEADLFPHLAIGQQLIFSIDLQDLFHIRLLLYHWGRSCRLLDWWAILCFFLIGLSQARLKGTRLCDVPPLVEGNGFLRIGHTTLVL